MQVQNSHRQQALEHLNHIMEIQSRLVGASFNLTEFMNLVVEQVQSLTFATGVVVELLDNGEMVYRAASGTLADHIGLRLPAKNSISGLCVASKEILRSDDTELDNRVNLAACRLVGARSLVVAPLFHNGNAVGVLKILSDKPNVFSDDDVRTLELMAGVIGSALGQQLVHYTTEKLLEEKMQALEKLKKTKDKLKQLANFDFLTNLPNRSLFMDRLNVAIKNAKRYGHLLAIFFLDIDHFKTINDTYGHATGDELLKKFAQRVKACIRESDTLSRFGGDEFVILLTEITNRDNAVVIAKKIINKMQNRFILNNEKFVITTSIGITFFENQEITIAELLKQADAALYAAKKSNRNTYKIYKKDNQDSIL